MKIWGKLKNDPTRQSYFIILHCVYGYEWMIYERNGDIYDSFSF